MATIQNDEIGRQREDEVVRLYTRDRLTFRQIAERIGADVKNTHEAWKRGRARLHREASEAFGEMVGGQLATCKQLIDGLMPVVLRGDSNSAKAAEAIVRAMDHEAKLPACTPRPRERHRHRGTRCCSQGAEEPAKL